MNLFQAAKPASFARNYAKTLVQTVVFWAVFLFIGPPILASIEDAVGLPTISPLPFLGVPLFIAFGALGLTSGFFMALRGEGTPLPMDCPRKLVVVGPYRFVRNPMAVAGVSQGIAVGLYLGSPLVVVGAVAGALFWNRFVRPPEEDDLTDRFGESFQHYRNRVRCWWPRVTGYVAPAD